MTSLQMWWQGGRYNRLFVLVWKKKISTNQKTWRSDKMADEYSIIPVNSSKCTMNPLLSILFLGLACVSTIFQILAFSTHGWVVMTEFLTDDYTKEVRSVEIYTGLWYTVKCAKGACSSVTHHEAFKEDITDGKDFKGILSYVN